MDKPSTTPGAQDPQTAFFVTGGTLALDAPSYVERDADRQILSAFDSKDALTRLDQTGTFVGTVQQVVTTPDHTWPTLVFADDKAALTARLHAGSYTVFPPRDRLKGKRILVTGRFDLDKAKAPMELVEPTQIQIVAGT